MIMTAEEQGKIKVIIATKIKRLEKQIAELKELTKPIAPDCAIGRVSRMDAINNKSVSEAMLVKKKNQLNKLKLSQGALSDADFENCIVCTTKIPIERLFIMPESRMCMNCASRSRG